MGFLKRMMASVGVGGARVDAQVPNPNDYLTATIGRAPVVVMRDAEGRLGCFLNSCRHKGAIVFPATSGNGAHHTCPYHGWTFGDDGRCGRIPSSTENVPPPPRAHLQTIAVEERYGLVWVCLGTPRAAIPHMSFEDDPTFRRINTPVEVWTTSSTRMADNFLDITHFPYVHIGTFGRAQDTVVPKVELGELDDAFYAYWTPAPYATPG